jgi:hypothetical protein
MRFIPISDFEKDNGLVFRPIGDFEAPDTGDETERLAARYKAPEPPPPEPQGLISRAIDTVKGTVSSIPAAISEKFTPYKSVMETYQPTAEEQQAELDKRLSYGAGPVSLQTVAKADEMRRGLIPIEEGPALTVAKAREQAKETSFFDLVDRAKESEALQRDTETLRRQRFGEENPLTGALQAGMASSLAGAINAPTVAAQLFNDYAVNPLLQAAGLQPLPKVGQMFGTEYLTKTAAEYMPKINSRSSEGAIAREEFGKWLGVKLAANLQSTGMSMAAMFAPPLRAVLLPSMGATSAGQSYVQGDPAIIAAAKGAIEIGTEMLPLKVFDKIGDALKGMSPLKQSSILAVAGQRLLQAGGQQTIAGVTNAIEETAAQFGGNVLDKYFQGKDIELTKGLQDAAIVGAVSGNLISAPQTAGILTGRYEPQNQIAQAIDENVANTQFTGVDEIARQQLSPFSNAPTNLNIGKIDVEPVDTSTIFTATDASSAAAAAAEIAGGIPSVNLPPINLQPLNLPGQAEPALTDLGLPPLPPAVEPVLTDLALPPLPPAVEPALDLNAPLQTNVATEQQFGLDKLRLTPPRPQKIQGQPVADLTDDQLTTIASDETIPAITRRSASVELTARQNEAADTTLATGLETAPITPAEITARQNEAAGTTVATGLENVPSVPLANAPTEQAVDRTLALPESRVSGNAIAPVGGEPAAAGAIEQIADKTLVIPESQVPSTAIAPVGGESAAAGARATAQVAIDRWAAANGVETPAVFDAAPAELDSAVNQIGQALNSQFGGKLYAYVDPRPNSLNGVAIGGAAFVNTANVDVNVARTSLHEFHHTVEQIAKLEGRQGLVDTPAQQYVAKVNTVFDDMDEAGKRSYLVKFLHAEELASITDPVAKEQRIQEMLAEPRTRSEMVADFLGNRATDKEFWKDVAATDPKGFKGFVDKWLGIVDNMLSVLKGTPTQGQKESALVDTYIRDLSKAKVVARDALIAYNKGTLNADITGNQGIPELAASNRQVFGTARSSESPEYGTAREGAVSVVAQHFSTQPRTSLNGAYYGTGLKGAERDRLDSSPDPRLKNRVYFYVDQGSGIRPEAGVGGIGHEAKLNNIYDPQTKLIPPKSSFNAFESAVINAGFDGYLAPFGNNQSAVVLLGPRHSAVPVRSLGSLAGAPAPTPAEPTTLKKGLLSKELSTIEAARVPGARIAGGNLEIPATSREAANAELERIGSDVRFSKKEIPEAIDNFAKLETVVPRAREGSYTTNRQLKVDLQTKMLEAAKAAEVDLSAQTDEAVKYLTRVGVADALYAIQSNANAVGWYDKTVTKALRILGKIHPEINSDPNAKFAFTWALAVTSNGLKVDKNFELAERAYKEYKRTGKMPNNLTAGQAQKAINESLDLFNKMVAQYGIDDVRKFMDSKFKVSQIERATGLDVGGEFKETEVRGAAVLGPKIGNGFYSNLNGFFDQLTMDRWLMRTWGRWTGTLIEARPDMVKAKQDELAGLVAKMKQNAPAAMEFQKALQSPLQTDDLDALAMAIQKASMDPATREAFNRTEVGQSIRKTGNALAKYLDGQKEAPAGPEERNFIRKVFNKILTDVRAKGYPALTMSDLQALLWYPEKRLYDIAKSDENTKEGYSDDEAPDYANAAAKLARGVGVSDAEIQSAINEAEKDYENRVSAGPAEPSAGGQQAQANVPEAVRGFGEREGRTFLTTGVIHRVRSAGSDPTSQPNSYKRKGGGDDKGSRVLGIPTVAIFSPATTFKNALGEVPAAAPKFFEVGADGAKTFRDSIQASKEGSVFGASVYVYDQSAYEGMRLFLSEDGKAGFALKGDDIVSVFAGPEQRGAVNGILQLATQEGGRRLDAFDTVLPFLYSIHGFKPVARSKWNDEFAPDDWNKETFKDFNNGEPDVVFMVHDPKSFARYDQADGKVIKDYDQGAVEQASALANIKQVRQTDLESLESVFKSLEKRGLAKANAEAAVNRRPDAAQINYMQDNFLDILDELDTAGLVEINC